MSNKEKELEIEELEDTEDDDDLVIIMTDEDGNEYYYRQEMVIPVGDDNYALLVAMYDEDEADTDDEPHEHTHEHEDGCYCCCDDDDVIIAKIVKNDEGEDEYVEPTDEEFDAVQEAYDKLMDEEFGPEDD